VDDLRLLTVREVCKTTRLGKSTIYKLLEQGVLRRVRLPGCSKVLIAEAEVRRYINDGVSAGCTPAIA
jgi:excisionase family DNA binding protein